MGIKKDIYEQIFRTPDYYVFDLFNPDYLRGWHLDFSEGYQELTPNDRGWLWCQQLGLWLGTWEGKIENKAAVWLRFYDCEGNLVLLPEEVANQRLQTAREEGFQEGFLKTFEEAFQKSYQEGFQEGVCQQLLLVLTARFWDVPQEVETRLRSLNVEQLKELTYAVLRMESLAQFTSLLSQV